MDIVNCFKVFFLSIVTQLLRFVAGNNPQKTPSAAAAAAAPPPPPRPLAAADPETTVVEQQPQPQPQPPVLAQPNLDWPKLIIAFCFTSSIEIALQSLQTQSHLPSIFHLLSLAISLAFASLFVGKFIESRYPITAQALERAGVFFAATAFFLAVSIPYTLSLKCTTWAVYAVSLLAIFICNC